MPDVFGPDVEQEGGAGVELFPVNFTTYRDPGLPDLDTEEHVTAIAGLLGPFGPQVRRWTVPGDERDRQAAEDRLGAWKRAAGRHGNSILYWVGHGSADHLAHHRTPAPIDDGILPEELARAIGARLLHPDSEHSWTVVVLDACFSHEFAHDVHLALMHRHRGARRYLLLSTAARGYAELGAFTRALGRALTVSFRGRNAIGLAELGQELARDLGGYNGSAADDHRDRLVRLDDDISAAISAPLDQLDELQSVIDHLPADEQRHFVPKASGAEFGELAWYFHGRTLQRDRILRWLTTARQGTLVVTGPAGAGKSALLGHILLRTRSELREILTRHGHLTALPPGTPCPDDPFDLTAHLAGLTLNQTIRLIADAAHLPDLARDAAQGQPATALASRLLTELRERRLPLTLLFDALDEADQPLAIADTLLRPIASLPNVRLVVGTRRSTREGPDQPAPADTDILDALQSHARSTQAQPTEGAVVVEVGQDPEALAGYLGAKLTTAKRRGVLDADDTAIAAAVHRLVVDHPEGGGQPQQFLYARLAAHELLNDPHLITDPAPLIGRTHRHLFSRALERLNRTNPHYGPLLNALGLAQGRGLPDQDGVWARVADALAPQPALAQTRSTIQELLHDAAPYIALDQEHRQSVYRLAHRTFTEHFTTDPGTRQQHADITTALIHHASSALQRPSAHDAIGASTAPAAVSPYTRHHLAAHARLGHTAGALHTLGDHLQVLDALDLTSITTAIFGHGLPAQVLPPAMAGTALLQHHVRDTVPAQASAAAWRRWCRRLGTTYIEGTPPPAEPSLHDTRTQPPDLVTGQVQRRQLLQLAGHTDWVKAVVVFTASDGTARVATGSGDGMVRIWDPVTGAQVGEPLTGHTGAVNAVAVFTASDGTVRLVTGSNDGTVRIWDPAIGAQVGELLASHTGWVRAVAVFTALDGTVRLVAGSGDGMVRIWDPVTGAQVGASLTGHTGAVNAVAVFTASDGTVRLVTGSDDGTVRIWDPVTGAQVGELLASHTGWVRAVAVFTALDGTVRLVTGSDDGTVRIWDPVTGAQVGELLAGRTGWGNGVRAVAVFTALDGTVRLVTGSDDRTVRIWDPVTGAQVGELLAARTGWGHAVRAVAVFTAPDGSPRLATGSHDETVQIWDPATGRETVLPLAAGIHLLAAADGLLLVGTVAGFLCLDLSSMYNHPTDTGTVEPRGAHNRP
ncbi:WD40 repeat domain-containing protein [Streptomyces tauricus]|uniref:WD40 repeat domain-containing protein n=1 Tax=Streptomyces tauricus TaxID=68274 RepID=UPI0022434413|nr:WD40 repeat domain-containing protein [Streptomyces tauricus]MCW8097077.1 WD40 repeat domain-containing protein [Streptomyces tauricus]